MPTNVDEFTVVFQVSLWIDWFSVRLDRSWVGEFVILFVVAHRYQKIHNYSQIYASHLLYKGKDSIPRLYREINLSTKNVLREGFSNISYGKQTKYDVTCQYHYFIRFSLSREVKGHWFEHFTFSIYPDLTPFVFLE